MSTKSFKKNFSLIELLAVIAIMSMLIAIVGAAMKPDPVNSASRELSGAINKARSYALSKRKYTVVHITLKDDKFAQIEPITYYNSAADLYTATASEKGIVEGSTTNYLNKGATVTTNDPPTQLDTDGFYISFHPNGGVNFTTPHTSSPYKDAELLDISGKYYLDIIKRGNPDNKVTLYINKFTGMVSF